MTKFTNVSAGPRGLNTKHGQIIVAPRQTVDVEIEKVEADAAIESKWFVKGDAPADEPGDDVSALKTALQERDATIADLQKGVTDRDAEITELKAKLVAKEGGQGGPGGATTLEAKHRGAGSYSIMDGETELREKLTKEQAETFNALDADGKAKWLTDNPAPAA